MAKILLIDNYDSFTYNIVQYLAELGAEVDVFRNDAITPEAIAERQPDGIVISPGPGNPNEAGVSLEVIRRFAGKIPLLGVCLGEQSLGQVYGGQVVRAPYLMHGRTSAIHHDGKGVFAGLPNPFTATRYHSLVVDRASLPDCLEVSAWTEDGLVMGLRHKDLPTVEGVQFHPESILTEAGKPLLANFLAMSGQAA
jgi:anthranilate synthase/aminodeoxychorismate synthase-like glutamine amidotransferase